MADSFEASAKQIRDIIGRWSWGYFDPDGVVHRGPKDLEEIVNRLAMAGVSNPEHAILTLLCKGDLTARGDYRWKKYHNGQRYELDQLNVEIDSFRWAALLNLIEIDRHLSGFGLEHFDLVKLDVRQCPPFSWNWWQGFFETATCTTELQVHDRNYTEEWFSARDLAIWPTFLNDDGSQTQSAFSYEHAIDRSTQKRGRKPAYDWEASVAKIWGQIYRGDLVPENQAQIERAFQILLTKGGKEPSESTVRPYANRIWAEIAKA